MMATVPHVTSGLGHRKFQADGYLLTGVYNPIFKFFGKNIILYQAIRYVASTANDSCKIN